MQIRNLYRGAIAAIALAGFVGTTSVAQASPWNWLKHTPTSIAERAEKGAIGAVAAVAGATALAASPLLAVNMSVMAAVLGGTGAAIAALAAPITLAVVGAGALAFGGYELYKSHEGLHLVRGAVDLAQDGYNGVRNAMTKVQFVDIMGDPFPIPAGSSPASQNAGMHH